METMDPDPDRNTTKGAKLDVGYIVDRRLLEECSRIDKVRGRSFMLHSLLSSYQLTKRLRLFPLRPASLEDLLVFHSKDYVEFLANPSQELEEEFGFGYDCPVLERMSDFALTCAAGSLTAAALLLERRVRVAVNWSGGWHHARRDAAAGFCYVNDIVLAVHRLQAGFRRILYVDLDVHHGDGVEDAFSSTDKVLSLSIHKMEPGFFPGTGAFNEVGFGKGRFHSVNVPLQQGCDDKTFCSVFSTVFNLAKEKFQPDVFVVQCGADGLAGDPLGGFNLTPLSLSFCVKKIVDLGLPVLLLGGGGYNIPNTVRCWTRITADLLECPLAEDIPDSDPFFLRYGPDYGLEVTPGLSRNCNTEEYLRTVVDGVRANLEFIGSS